MQPQVSNIIYILQLPVCTIYYIYGNNYIAMACRLKGVYYYVISPVTHFYIYIRQTKGDTKYVHLLTKIDYYVVFTGTLIL